MPIRNRSRNFRRLPFPTAGGSGMSSNPSAANFTGKLLIWRLREAREHGQTLAIRLMPYTDKHPLPDWYRNSGARRANKPTDKDGNIWQPDYTDPLFLKYWGEIVAEAGKRYDGNPFLDSVDISSIGYWGEGWSPYMPSFFFSEKTDGYLVRRFSA